MVAAKSVSEQDFSILLSRLDQQIRGGQSSIAKAELQNLLEKKIKFPRKQALEFAKIARRLSLPYLSLQIMRPIVHPKIPIHPAANDSEKAVYAGALAKIGAASEALGRLEKLDPLKTPEVYFHKSTIYFQQWHYAKAIPILKKYVKHKGLSEYEVLVGKINLAAAYVLERKVTEAESLLNELLQSTQEKNLQLLYGNALELSAQREIFAGRYDEAEKFLQIARKCLGQTSNLSEFFIRKWMAVLNVKKHSNVSAESISELESIRDEAIGLEHWETVRECDFFLSLTLKSKSIFSHVYFGTPFYKYREKMKTEGSFTAELPKKYIWHLGGLSINEKLRVFDLNMGRELESTISISVGSILHKALSILCQDFYRPVTEGSFFSQLFPDEYFNYETSPSRVSQIIQRLRAWFTESQIPLEIESIRSAYRLMATSDYGIQILRVVKSTDPRMHKIEILKNRWPYQAFSSKEAAEELQCSVSTIVRLFNWAVTHKKIYHSGRGSAVLYRFAK
jgi:tetratricopeptide (TPR) repeat protein